MTYAAEAPVAERAVAAFKTNIKQIKICNFDLAHEGQELLNGRSKILNCCKY